MTGLPSIVAGMVNVPDAFLSQPVMVTVSSIISYFKLSLTGVPSAGLVSTTGSTVVFSPHPPRRRGSVTMIRNKGTGFMASL